MKDLKENLFGKKKNVNNSDRKRVINEFNEIYSSIYKESIDALQKSIRKVERKFDKTKPTDQENYDF